MLPAGQPKAWVRVVNLGRGGRRRAKGSPCGASSPALGSQVSRSLRGFPQASGWTCQALQQVCRILRSGLRSALSQHRKGIGPSRPISRWRQPLGMEKPEAP